MFDPTTRVLSGLGMAVDCRQSLPERLESFATLLLAESCLSGLDNSDVARVRAFAAKGGRVVLACNAFMVGTVSKANAILEGHGLKVVDQDYGRDVTVTNLVSDKMTVGVRKLEFFRPSLVQVVDPAKGKALAIPPSGVGGLVAVSRVEGGGEIVVLGASMWWGWLHEFESRSDNVGMMRNLLSGHRMQ